MEPSPITTLSQYRYYVTFIYDYTRYNWVYLMKKKFEVFTYFRNFLQMIKIQDNTVMRNIRFDNGREYITNEFRSELNKVAILQLTCPYTPEQNVGDERKNRRICLWFSVSSMVWVFPNISSIWLPSLPLIL